MSLDDALRLTEILLAFAFLQQSLEHASTAKQKRHWFFLRVVLSLLLLAGFHPAWVCLALVGVGLWMLGRFQGPYNGGSDRMSLLILCSVCLVHFLPTMRGKETVFGYLAVQCLLSYCIAGWVKIANPEWRSGQALRDVLQFSAYPASESIRRWAERPRLVRLASWSVMTFELFFPLCILTQPTLIFGLMFAAGFHLANACLFGLNRFLWIWLAAYPSIFWLQGRIFS